jgi:flagellar hook-associated protein 1
MSLSLALDSALSGLMAAQRQTAVMSRNVANANTPGYTRKNAELTSQITGGEGSGVQITGISRTVDASLQRDSRRESGLTTELQTKAAQLKAFTDYLGQPNDEQSISSQITKLTNALQQLGESPEDTTVQQSVVAAAQNVAQSLNGLSDQIKTQRQDADAGIAESVSTINQTLDDLAKLNEQISQRSDGNQDTTDLQDQRDQKLDTLAKQLGITYFTRDHGEVVVLTAGGTTLVDGKTVHHLAFSQTTQITASQQYTPGGAGLSGVTVNGLDISPGSGYPGSINSGQLAAQFALRDQIFPQAQAQIDEIASTLADGFQRQDATVAPGMTGLFTDNGAAHDRTDPTQVTGLAGRIAVNALVVPAQGGDLWRLRTGLHAAGPGAPGDATQVRAFLDLFDQSVSFSGAAGLSTTGRIGDYASSFVGFQANQRAALDDRSQYQASISSAIDSQRANVEGVSVDDEMQKMLLLEQSYAASAKVIQAVSDMMDSLLAIGR